MSGDDFDVSGGTGGVAARYADMLTLARHSEDFSADLAVINTQCHAVLVDPNLLASAVLNPVGAAKVEALLLNVLDGPTGLTSLSVGYDARSVSLRALVASYQAGDAASAWALDQLRWLAGYGALPVAGAAVAAPMLALGPLLGPAVLTGVGVAAARFTRDGGWEQLLYDHPGVVDTVVGAAPGLITFLPGTPLVGDVPQAARLLGLLWPDGDPRIVGVTGDAGPGGAAEKPPQDLGDLLEALHHRNVEADPYEPAQVDVRVVTHADGSRAYIVDVPGTKVWNPPWQGEDNQFLNNLGTNVHVSGGQTTALERGIAEVLEAAGATPDDPVMLVGHSQGGMVATQFAHDAGAGAFDFNVTHVVTAGSPIGNTTVPGDVQVLALENLHDVVPHLDATDNPDRPNVTTVTFDSDSGTLAGSHHTDTYLAAAERLDMSTDPSVLAFTDSADQFLSGSTTVDTRMYELTREY